MVNNRKLLFDKEDTYSLRGLCMLAILAHHLFQFTSTRYGVYYPWPIAFSLQSTGYLASAVFFLISGYGMTLSLWKRNPDLPDALKRISKIYLPYFFFYVVCIVLITFDNNRYYALSDLGSLVTFQLPYMGGGKWFIITILALYCCLMVVSRIVETKTKAAVIMIVLIVVYVLLQMTVLHMSPLWYNSIIAFPVGVLCAAKKDVIQKYNNSKVGILLIAVFILSHFAYFTIQRLGIVADGNVILLYQIVASLSLALYSIRLVSRISVRNSVLDSIGIYSLSVLLAQQVLVVYASRISNVYAYVLIVIVGTFALTWIYSRIHKQVFSPTL